MNIARAIFVSFLIIFKVNPSLQYEHTIDLNLYRNVLQSDHCEEQIKILLRSPKILQHFIDASAYIPRNLKRKETLQFPGDPSNCLSIDVNINGTAVQGKYTEVTVEVPTQSDEAPDFVTRQKIIKDFERRRPYRLYYGMQCKGNFPPKPQLQDKNTTTVSLGLCVPRACSTAEAIDIVLDTENRYLTVGSQIRKYRLPNDRAFSTADLSFTIVLSCVILFAIVGTAYDIKTDTTTGSSTADSLYRSFSVHKNARQLLRVSSSKDTVECVDGIRAIAMALIIWLHCYTSKEPKIYALGRLDFQQFFNPFARYGVDTFFVLGGIFNVYSVMSKFTKQSFLTKLHVTYLNRLIRLYPVLCFEILAQASIMNHFSNDPMVESCRASWWIVLLFIQNVIYQCKGESLLLCSDHTWYLSVDMQLFIVSTLVLMWTFGKKTTAWIALSVAVTLSLTCSTIFSFLYKFPFNFVGTPDENLEHLLTHYSNTFTRASSYFIGMMIGYLLHCSKNQRLFLNTNKLWIWFMWCSTMLIFSVVFGAFIIWTKVEDHRKNQLLHNVLNSYWSSIWSVALGWLIVACHHGHGGLVNWFLSLKQWKLLSRLSYCMYVLHMPIVRLINDKSKHYDHGILKTNDFLVFQNFLCAFLATLVISFVVTVLIEVPVLNLQKLAQDKRKCGLEEKNIQKTKKQI